MPASKSPFAGTKASDCSPLRFAQQMLANENDAVAAALADLNGASVRGRQTCPPLNRTQQEIEEIKPYSFQDDEETALQLEVPRQRNWRIWPRINPVLFSVLTGLYVVFMLLMWVRVVMVVRAGFGAARRAWFEK